MIISWGLKNEFETAVVNEPSVFEPLKFYCNMKITLKHPKSAAMGFFPKGLENEFEVAEVNEQSVLEPLKVCWIVICLFRTTTEISNPD